MSEKAREPIRFARARALRVRAQRSARSVGAVLVYHRIGAAAAMPDVQIDPGVSPESFAGQLEHLRRHYRVVPASGILEATRGRRRGDRFPVAITFDDDLASHVLEACTALRRAGVPATFFLCGASLRAPHAFWWEDLQRTIDDRLLHRDELPHVRETDLAAALERLPTAIHRVASAIERLEPARRAEVAAALRAAGGSRPADSGIRASAVRALAMAGCEVGFHTLRHDALPGLSDAALAKALREGRDDLAAAASRPLELVAYPHGKGDQRVADAAQRAGFARGFTTVQRTVGPNTHPHLVPRIAPAPSPAGLALQLARAFATGVEPPANLRAVHQPGSAEGVIA
jgi:peptidoglycan/xylan/chitin deacetylase (PgdA/CDA1 family)